MKKFLLSLVWIFTRLLCAHGVDWCSLYCEEEMNTMCLYELHKDYGDCTNMKNVMTPENRDILLDLHNGYREEVASGKLEPWPKAVNMRRLSWDQDLEGLALMWAMQCENGNDKCRRTNNFAYVGQSAVRMESSDHFPDFNECFKRWTQRSQLTEPSILESYVPGQWRQFTQIIWANTFKLGCTALRYDLGEQSMNRVICNYGPGGNTDNETVYEEGEPCSEGECLDPMYPSLRTLSDDRIGKHTVDFNSSMQQISTNICLLAIVLVISWLPK